MHYPNIVLVTVDCLRADVLGCYGYDRPTTPVIDKLASSGLLMQNAFAHASGTPLSFPAIMSGHLPLSALGLNLSQTPLLAEAFRAAGYNTCAFQTNSWVGRQMGYTRGFTTYEEFYDLLEDLDSRLEFEVKNTLKLEQSLSIEEIELHLIKVFETHLDRLTTALQDSSTSELLQRNKKIAAEKERFHNDPLAYVRVYIEDLQTGNVLSKGGTNAEFLKQLRGLAKRIMLRAWRSLPKSVHQHLKFIRQIQSRPQTVDHLKKPYADAEMITQRAIDWISHNAGTPFFLWLHYMDVHKPYLPGSSYKWPFEINEHLESIKAPSITIEDADRQRIDKRRDLYDACVRYVDSQLGQLLPELRALPRETFVVVTADHGEEFFEHGDNNHLAKLFDELIRVPLIVSSVKGTKVPRVDTTTLVGLMDLGSSLLHLCGVNGQVGHGQNWFNSDYKRNVVLSETLEDIQQIALGKRYFTPITLKLDDAKIILGARSLNRKVIYSEHEEEFLGYDLTQDPREQRPIKSTQFDDVFLELEDIIRNRVSEVRVLRAQQNERGTPYTDEELAKITDQLRALGYIESQGTRIVTKEITGRR